MPHVDHRMARTDGALCWIGNTPEQWRHNPSQAVPQRIGYLRHSTVAIDFQQTTPWIQALTPPTPRPTERRR